MKRETASEFSLADEYSALSFQAGMVDRSHLTKLILTGRDSLDLLQRISTNDLAGLEPRAVCHTVLTTEKGRIIDLIAVHVLMDGSLLILSHAPEAIIRGWIQKFIIMEDVRVEDQTSAYGVLSIVGPRAEDILEKTFLMAHTHEPTTALRQVDLEGISVMLAPIDLVGLHGFNLLLRGRESLSLWQRNSGVGRTLGLRQCSLDALEILRIEQGVPVYGRELTEHSNPLEAGLQRLVSFSKGCYVGQEVIARIDTYEKLQKRLMGLVLKSTLELSSGTSVLSDGGTVGSITSSIYSPSHGTTIAMAYLRCRWAVPGKIVQIVERDLNVDAEVVELPFLR